MLALSVFLYSSLLALKDSTNQIWSPRSKQKKNKGHKEAHSAQYSSLCPQVQRYWKKQLPECEYFMQLPKEGMHISLIGKKCWTVVCFKNVY